MGSKLSLILQSSGAKNQFHHRSICCRDLEGNVLADRTSYVHHTTIILNINQIGNEKYKHDWSNTYITISNCNVITSSTEIASTRTNSYAPTTAVQPTTTSSVPLSAADITNRYKYTYLLDKNYGNYSSGINYHYNSIYESELSINIKYEFNELNKIKFIQNQSPSKGAGSESSGTVASFYQAPLTVVGLSNIKHIKVICIILINVSYTSLSIPITTLSLPLAPSKDPILPTVPTTARSNAPSIFTCNTVPISLTIAKISKYANVRNLKARFCVELTAAAKMILYSAAGAGYVISHIATWKLYDIDYIKDSQEIYVVNIVVMVVNVILMLIMIMIFAPVSIGNAVHVIGNAVSIDNLLKKSNINCLYNIYFIIKHIFSLFNPIPGCVAFAEVTASTAITATFIFMPRLIDILLATTTLSAVTKAFAAIPAIIVFVAFILIVLVSQIVQSMLLKAIK